MPRLSATVMLVRDRGGAIEVLMTRRHAAMHFASALVFPGGMVDAADHAPEWSAHCDGADGLDPAARALRIAACRETFEEVGILIGSGSIAPRRAPDAPFLDTVRAGGARLRLRLDALVPFAHWITPEGLPARFDTHFFLCRAPDGAEPVYDGAEVTAAEWATPATLIARAEAGDTALMFPTRLNLARLGESGDVAVALAAAAARPVVTVLPRLERRAGGTVAVIPADAGYAETEDLRPRS